VAATLQVYEQLFVSCQAAYPESAPARVGENHLMDDDEAAAVTDGPGTDGPVTDGPGTDGPGTDGPVTDGPGTDGPVTDGPDSIVVRHAVIDDADHITEAHVKAWQVAYRGIMPDSYLDDLSNDMADRRARWRVQIAAPESPAVCTLVAERDGTVVGWSSCAPSRDPDVTKRTGEVWGIYVHPDHWGTGAGGALMRASLEHLAGEGYTEATLWVFEENAQARGVYERYGWRPDGASEIFERGGAQAVEVRYRRPLP
jgi:GNAT superfamily N-acetyltransferase